MSWAVVHIPRVKSVSFVLFFKNTLYRPIGRVIKLLDSTSMLFYIEDHSFPNELLIAGVAEAYNYINGVLSTYYLFTGSLLLWGVFTPVMFKLSNVNSDVFFAMPNTLSPFISICSF